MALYDLVVIGSGPGGYVAAIRAAQLGLKTAIIEKESVGGVCLNWGCIPTKALLEAAFNFKSAEKCGKYGIAIDATGFSYASVHKESSAASERLAGGVRHLLTKNKVDVFLDTARLLPSGEVCLLSENKAIETKNVIIATGSRERVLKSLPFDGEKILSSHDALNLKELPEKIAIIGAGAIGVEFSTIFSTFGVEVSLIEMMGHVLPLEDEELCIELEKELQRSGIKLLTNAKVIDAVKKDGRISLELEQENLKKSLAVDKVLVAIGRQANSEGLGLEEAAIETDRGFVKTGDYYQTSRKGIYAVGDVIGQALLAHAASAQGHIAVEHIAGIHSALPSRLDGDRIPRAVYCEPQVASFGLGEAAAKNNNLDYSVGKFPFIGCGKAVATGKTGGFVKIIADNATKEILGASVMGANATEIIHELLLAKNSELIPEDIGNLVHAHPTLSEAVMEAAKGVFGEPIHI